MSNLEKLKFVLNTIKYPLILWNSLKERYEKIVILPKARYDWIHLCLQNFKTISEFIYVIFKITFKLKLCGENIINENIFHASNVLLQQQYIEKGFKKYFELISCLLVAKQNNEHLMKNHEAYPIGYAPFSKVNVATYYNYGQTRDCDHSRSCGHDHSCGHGHEGSSKNIFLTKSGKIIHMDTTHLDVANFFVDLDGKIGHLIVNVSTISSTTNIIKGLKRANILLLGGTKLHIDNALYSSKSDRNLLSFKDICLNG
ncbi:hypothetical protein CR513_57989, partial [Mucuna pruriens]